MGLGWGSVPRLTTNSQPKLLRCAATLANFAPRHDRLNAARIPGSPLAKGSQRPPQGSSETREGIFDLRGYLSEIDTIDNPVRLQFLELLNQHFVTDAADCASQLAIATGSLGQMEQDQRLPFASEHKQRCVQAAGKATLLHLSAIPELVLTKRCILERRNARPHVGDIIHATRTSWADLTERSRSSPALTVGSAWQARSGSSQRERMSTLPDAARRNWTKRSRRSEPA